MHHARADKAQINFLLGAIMRDGTYRVMRIALGNIGIFDIGVGNHRLINGIQIDHHFGKISGIGIRRQRRFVTRFNLANALIGNINQPLQHMRGIIHALIDHHLNARFGDFQRADQGFIIGNAY